jgi:hypothetical protein
MREKDGGGESKIHYKHICKCHNETTLYILYMLIRKRKHINRKLQEKNANLQRQTCHNYLRPLSKNPNSQERME